MINNVFISIKPMGTLDEIERNPEVKQYRASMRKQFVLEPQVLIKFFVILKSCDFEIAW